MADAETKAWLESVRLLLDPLKEHHVREVTPGGGLSDEEAWTYSAELLDVCRCVKEILRGSTPPRAAAGVAAVLLEFAGYPDQVGAEAFKISRDESLDTDAANDRLVAVRDAFITEIHWHVQEADLLIRELLVS
jgi:hypothetical protein